MAEDRKEDTVVLGTIFMQPIPEDILNGEEILKNPDQTTPTALAATCAKLNSDQLTIIINNLKNPAVMPLPAINEIAQLCWNIVGSRRVMFVCGQFPSIGFSYQKMPGINTPIICCPQDWFLRLQLNPYFQTGAVVSTASKVRDWWNGKFNNMQDFDNVFRRAAAYEAEYLLYVKTETPSYKLDKYQETIIKTYPNGLASLRPKLVYTSLPPPKHPLDG